MYSPPSAAPLEDEGILPLRCSMRPRTPDPEPPLPESVLLWSALHMLVNGRNDAKSSLCTTVLYYTVLFLCRSSLEDGGGLGKASFSLLWMKEEATKGDKSGRERAREMKRR